MNPALPYCSDTLRYQRRKTRVVRVGNVALGGTHPIRVQSMTTSDTLNTEATVKETLDLVAAGCEIVRITAPTVNDAENLKNIRDALRQRGCQVPLVADIHFLPKAAMTAVEYVDKIRINPGNYADKKKFATREYTDDQYHDELGRIEEAFTPLVKRCKELGRAVRIGTNHGSLSDRIMNRYGDTPLGMVESALEFVRICQKNDFHDLVLSMKASNPKVMIQAYRLLAARMTELGMDYPFHLGVTEAGDGEDGRIKSAAGIGTLLEDGIGDTIRVSLTEDAVHEIPVCRALLKKYNTPTDLARTSIQIPFTSKECRNPFQYVRRKSREIRIGNLSVGGEQTFRVEVPIQLNVKAEEAVRSLLACQDTPPEVFQVRIQNPTEFQTLVQWSKQFSEARFAADIGVHADWLNLIPAGAIQKLVIRISDAWKPEDFRRVVDMAKTQKWTIQALLSLRKLDLAKAFFEVARQADFSQIQVSMGDFGAPVITSYRMLVAWMSELGCELPIHLREEGVFENELDTLLGISPEFGSLLCDGIGDSIQIGDGSNPALALKLSYNILQATGCRITKTEYVSCPSCGRTLFNLQTVTERIKSKTGHLKGVKIAIMGCIVNGPGEMADADFGYVGGAPGKVNLYVGKECVQYHVPEAEADQRLMDLIKSHGKWQEP